MILPAGFPRVVPPVFASGLYFWGIWDTAVEIKWVQRGVEGAAGEIYFCGPDKVGFWRNCVGVRGPDTVHK